MKQTIVIPRDAVPAALRATELAEILRVAIDKSRTPFAWLSKAEAILKEIDHTKK